MPLHCHASFAHLDCHNLHLSVRPIAHKRPASTASCKSRQSQSASRRDCHSCHQKTAAAQNAEHTHTNSTCSVSNTGKLQRLQQNLDRLPLHFVAVVAALNTLAHPALADIQTVPASQATESAKPIPKQKTDKGLVALLFAAGAASLFGSAILLEKNSKLFPAINKANQVMRAAEQRNKGRAITEQAVTDLEQQDDMRLQRSVEAGLADARARVLPESGDSSASTSSSSKQAKDAEPDSSSFSESSSSASDPHANNGATTDDQVPYSSKNKDEASASPERSKGSQLSDEEKQQQAVKSITGS